MRNSRVRCAELVPYGYHALLADRPPAKGLQLVRATLSSLEEQSWSARDAFASGVAMCSMCARLAVERCTVADACVVCEERACDARRVRVDHVPLYL